MAHAKAVLRRVINYSPSLGEIAPLHLHAVCQMDIRI